MATWFFTHSFISFLLVNFIANSAAETFDADEYAKKIVEAKNKNFQDQFKTELICALAGKTFEQRLDIRNAYKNVNNGVDLFTTLSNTTLISNQYFRNLMLDLIRNRPDFDALSLIDSLAVKSPRRKYWRKALQILLTQDNNSQMKTFQEAYERNFPYKSEFPNFKDVLDMLLPGETDDNGYRAKLKAQYYIYGNRYKQDYEENKNTPNVISCTLKESGLDSYKEDFVMYHNNKALFYACHTYFGIRELAREPNDETMVDFRQLPTNTLIRIGSPEEMQEMRSVYKSLFKHFPEKHISLIMKKEFPYNTRNKIDRDYMRAFLTMMGEKDSQC